MATSTLSKDLHKILTTLNKFRRKHRLVHIQIHSVDMKWVDENGEGKTSGKKCDFIACKCSCVENGTCGGCGECEDNDEHTCECECSDCTECDICKGIAANTDFATYWGNETPFEGVHPLCVSINPIDGNNIWYTGGNGPKAVVDDIAEAIVEDINEQRVASKVFVEARDAAEASASKCLQQIARLCLLQDPDAVKSSEDLASEQVEEDEFCPSVERFKCLDLG